MVDIWEWRPGLRVPRMMRHLASFAIRTKSGQKWHRHPQNHDPTCFCIMKSTLYGCNESQTKLHWRSIVGIWEWHSLLIVSANNVQLCISTPCECVMLNLPFNHVAMDMG